MFPVSRIKVPIVEVKIIGFIVEVRFAVKPTRTQACPQSLSAPYSAASFRKRNKSATRRLPTDRTHCRHSSVVHVSEGIGVGLMENIFLVPIGIYKQVQVVVDVGDRIGPGFKFSSPGNKSKIVWNSSPQLGGDMRQPGKVLNLSGRGSWEKKASAILLVMILSTFCRIRPSPNAEISAQG